MTRMKYPISYLVIGILFLSSHLDAQSFLKTENDQIMETGDIAVTLKGTYLRDAISFDNQLNSKILVNGPSLDIRSGLGQRIDFKLNWDILRYIKIHHAQYLDTADISFFTKIKLLSEGTWPSLNLRIGAKLPNASEETH